MYLQPTHPDAFTDFPPPVVAKAGYKTCPLCTGHGGWNLKLNAYPMHHKENTPENRHTFSHFRSLCRNCFGYGEVPDHQSCIHEWEWKENKGRCLNLYVCVHCQSPNLVDSSD